MAHPVPAFQVATTATSGLSSSSAARARLTRKGTGSATGPPLIQRGHGKAERIFRIGPQGRYGIGVDDPVPQALAWHRNAGKTGPCRRGQGRYDDHDPGDQAVPTQFSHRANTR